MQDNIIQRLFCSFSELEKAIHGARATLEKKSDIPVEILERLSSYDEILAKQRNLANELCEHVSGGNWDEVTRHVTLINSLSALIRDDARTVLSAFAANSDSAEEIDYPFC